MIVTLLLMSKIETTLNCVILYMNHVIDALTTILTSVLLISRWAVNPNLALFMAQ